jgi:deoxyribodipyrimidine photolyase-related protein
MSSIRLILGDQLSETVSSLKDYNPDTDVILICEVWDEVTYVKHHKKKIAFLFSAMRHFAEVLIHEGYIVEYTKLNDPDNAGSFKGEAKRILQKYALDRIIVTHPGEYRVLEEIRSLEDEFSIPVEIREDDRFLCKPDEFASWAKDRKQLRLEYFYREMRKKYNILMQDGTPIGGQWNYDAENRKPPKEGLTLPSPYIGKIDDITQEVMSLVSERFDDHFGDLEPFYFAVTRVDALHVLDQFIEQRLSHFGDYQDAMIQGEPWIYHSHISFYLNCGLLLPLECVQAAEKAYHQRKAPLNAVEGFIRQIIGWREYVRGIYWLKMPSYAEANFFGLQTQK